MPTLIPACEVLLSNAYAKLQCLRETGETSRGRPGVGHGVHPATQAELGEVLVRHRAVPSHILVCVRQEHRARHAGKEHPPCDRGVPSKCRVPASRPSASASAGHALSGNARRGSDTDRPCLGSIAMPALKHLKKLQNDTRAAWCPHDAGGRTPRAGAIKMTKRAR